MNAVRAIVPASANSFADKSVLLMAPVSQPRALGQLQGVVVTVSGLEYGPEAVHRAADDGIGGCGQLQVGVGDGIVAKHPDCEAP